MQFWDYFHNDFGTNYNSKILVGNSYILQIPGYKLEPDGNILKKIYVKKIIYQT